MYQGDCASRIRPQWVSESMRTSKVWQPGNIQVSGVWQACDCIMFAEQAVPFMGSWKEKPAKCRINLVGVWCKVPYAVDGKVYIGQHPRWNIQRNLGENVVPWVVVSDKHVTKMQYCIVLKIMSAISYWVNEYKLLGFLVLNETIQIQAVSLNLDSTTWLRAKREGRMSSWVAWAMTEWRES